MGIIRDTFTRIRTKAFGVMGQYNLTPPTLADGECCILQLDENGNVLVSGGGEEGCSFPAIVPASMTDPVLATARAVEIGQCYGKVWVAPIGTGADDWVRLFAILTACAGLYEVRCLPLATWICDHIGSIVPSETTLDIRNCRIESKMVHDPSTDWVPGSGNDVVFHTIETVSAVKGILIAATVRGSPIVYTSCPVALTPVGSEVELQDSTAWTYRHQHYQVESVSLFGAADDLDNVGGATSSWVLVGAVHQLKWVLTGHGVDTTIELWDVTVSPSVKVASGSLGGIGGGTITLSSFGGSGVSGSVVVIANPINDTGVSNLISYKLTLSRPVLQDWDIGDNVLTCTEFGKNIHIDARGCVVTGTGTSALYFWGAHHCSVIGLVCDDSAGGFSTCVHDIAEGCYDVHFGSTEDPNRTSYYTRRPLDPYWYPRSCSIESSEYCTACINTIGTFQGIDVYWSTDCEFYDCQTSDCQTTLHRSFRSIRCGFVRCQGSDSVVGNGFDFTHYGEDCYIDHASASNCVNGMIIQHTEAHPHINDLQLSQNRGYGLQVASSGTVNPDIDGLVCQGNQINLRVEANCVIRNYLGNGAASGFVDTYVASTCSHFVLQDSKILPATVPVSMPYAVSGNSTGKIELRNCEIHSDGLGGFGLGILGGGTVTRENVEMVGTPTVYVATGGSLVDLEGVIDATAPTLVGTATSNSGTFVADGTNPNTVTLALVESNSVFQVVTGAGVLAQPSISIYPEICVVFGVLPAGTYRWRYKNYIQSSSQGDWIKLFSSTDYVSTAASSSTITMVSDKTQKILNGMPIRVLDKTGVEIVSLNGQISGYSGISGITSAVLDVYGRLYFSIVSDGAGFYHVAIYNDVSRSAGKMVAHTASYNAPGIQALIVNNSSGIGGSISIDAVTSPNATIVVEFYKWYIVESCTSVLLTLRGPPLDTTAGRVTELWYGPATRAVPFPITVGGSYALVASTGILASVMKRHLGWVNRGPRLRVAYFELDSFTVSVNAKANVNLMVAGNALATDNGGAGMTLTAAQTPYRTVVNLDAKSTLLDYGSSLEVKTSQGDTTGTVDADLRIEITCVLE